MSTLPTLPSGDGGPGKKSFWQRPEGRTGLVINALVIFAIFWFWGLIVPFVLATVTNTLFLALYLLALFALLYVLFDPNFRRFVWYLYRSIMRWITGMVVDIDPIGVLKTYIEKLREKKQDLESAMADIRGQRMRLQKSLAENEKGYANSMRTMAAAESQKNDPDSDKQRRALRMIQLEGKQVVRLQDLLTKQKQHMQRYDYVIDVLTRYSEICDDTILDMDRDIKYRQMDRDQSRGFAKAMRASMSILRGMPDEKEMYDMSIESLEKDYAAKIGEVESILDLTKNVVSAADFNDAASMQHASELLAKWQADGGKTPTKQISGAHAITGASSIAPEKQPVSTEVDDYRKFF